MDPASKAFRPSPGSQILSLEDFIRQVQPLLRIECKELQFHGMTDEIYDALEEKAYAGELPDFGKLCTDLTGEHLILWWKAIGLDFMHLMYSKIPPDLCPGKRPFTTLGSLDVRLENGIKSPAYSHYERTNHQYGKNKYSDWMQSLPTLVWEVAYSDASRQLGRNCARFVACSLGAVCLAIGIVVTLKDAPEEEERLLERVTCSFWKVITFDAFDTLGDEVIDALIRTDGGDDNDVALPPATKYKYTSQPCEGPGGYSMFGVASETFEIYPYPLEGGHVEILQKHTLRQPADGDEDKVVLKIPFSVIVDAIKDQERFRSDHYRGQQYILTHREEWRRDTRNRMKVRFPNAFLEPRV